MHTSVGVLAWPGGRPNWMLLFAREPEPDVEFTEEDLEEPAKPRSTAPKPPKRGGRPLLWVLLLLLAGAAAYAYLEPDMAMDLLSPILGDSFQQAKTVRQPPQPGAAAKVSPPTTSPTPAPNAPAPAPPSPPPMTAPSTGPVPSGVASAPSPLFGEGQVVTVVLDPSSPGDSITLFLDSAGTRPGPTIRPGMTLIVLDGELSNNSWVYAVRAEDGSKGWILEKRLKAKS